MSINKVISKIKDIFCLFKGYRSYNFIDSSIKNVIILYDSKSPNFKSSLQDLKKAIYYIREDYNIDFLDIVTKDIDISRLSKFDFILVKGDLGSEIDKHVRKLFKTITIPKGILISNKNFIRNSKQIKYYQVIWFSNFESVKQLRHSRKYHAFNFENKDNKSTPNWDLRYYGYQLQKGMNSLVKDDVRISKRLYSNETLKVGKHSFYNSNFKIIGKDSYVEIGSYCSIGNNVKIYTTNHDTNFAATQGYLYRKYFKTNHPGEEQYEPSKSRTKGPILIKNDVWIGDDVKIMSGVTVGNGACIASGSVLTSDVGDYEIYGGVPARFLKHRFEQNVIMFLKEQKWWDWSDNKIKNNEAFFNLNLNESKNIERFKINT